MAKFLVISIIIILINLITLCYTAVPMNRYESLMKNEENPGLYNDTDHVLSLTFYNLRPLVFGQNYATLLEFYNSFCGHCRRYATTYKKLANETWSWNKIIKIMAIDCANDKNNDICREYEIMSYPTLRYFSPKTDNTSNLGINIKPQNVEIMKNIILNKLSNETHYDNTWPDFSDLTDITNNNFFNNLNDNIQLGILIYENINSTLGVQLILDFYDNKKIHIKRTTSHNVAKSYNIETFNTLATIDRKNNIETISVANVSPNIIKNSIKQILEHKNLNINSNENLLDKGNMLREITNTSIIKEPLQKPNQAILNEIKNNPKYTVYQADLEHALRYTIYHEIPRISHINGERLLALQRYLNVLSRYNPLGINGQKFLKNLQEYTNQNNQEIRGIDFQRKLSNIENDYLPIFSTSRWIGCTSSKSGLRGFTCGLWQLFHFMTVQAAENDISTDPLEVLQAMHGYIKYFFGCSDCSNHFQTMANNRKIWSTASKDDAILWLWSSHNVVNKRLAGDETEDPLFPKIQFPTKESCEKCYREQHGIITDTNEINWDKQAVLEFLKNIHNPQNLSRFGIDDETVLPPTIGQIRQKRNLTNVFSDIDMRMGILLYGFCIIMMLFAVKLFLHRGYRKKAYSHDFLGKV